MQVAPVHHPSDALAAPAWPAAWLRPRWPAPANVRAFCTGRAGGVSLAPYDALNLGDHVGDAPEAVAANRAHLQQALGVRPVFLNQVHGTEVLALHADCADGAQADGSWTAQPGLACTVMVADCLPVLLCSADGSRVAALHAGWRGLAGGVGEGEGAVGVLESFVQSQSAQGVVPEHWMAWLGPCIGPQAFEVGDEVRAAFVDHSSAASQAFVPHGPGKWLADLALLARQRLQAQGVSQVYGNDGSAPWCTVGNPLRFFSHRRDRVSGRQAAGIWRV
jgi:YfiH family protein